MEYQIYISPKTITVKNEDTIVDVYSHEKDIGYIAKSIYHEAMDLFPVDSQGATCELIYDGSTIHSVCSILLSGGWVQYGSLISENITNPVTTVVDRSILEAFTKHMREFSPSKVTIYQE